MTTTPPKRYLRLRVASREENRLAGRDLRPDSQSIQDAELEGIATQSPGHVVADRIGATEPLGTVSINDDQAAESGDAGQRKIETTSIRIRQAKTVKNVQSFASEGEIDAVSTEAKVIHQLGIDHRGS